MKKVYAVATCDGRSVRKGERFRVLQEYDNGRGFQAHGLPFACWTGSEHLRGGDFRREVVYDSYANPLLALTSKVPFTQKRKIPLP